MAPRRKRSKTKVRTRAKVQSKAKKQKKRALKVAQRAKRPPIRAKKPKRTQVRKAPAAKTKARAKRAKPVKRAKPAERTKRAKPVKRAKPIKRAKPVKRTPTRKPIKVTRRPAKRRALPKGRVTASVAARSAQAAIDRFLQSDLKTGLESLSGHGQRPSDATITARKLLARDIYARDQTGQAVSETERDWFAGYARPDGSVGRHYCRLRWEDFADKGKIRRRLEEAYAEGQEVFDDHAARVAEEWNVNVREVYTLFWS